jgi:hypothetical protein
MKWKYHKESSLWDTFSWVLFVYHTGEVTVLAVTHLRWLAIALEAWSSKPSSMKQQALLAQLRKNSWKISNSLFFMPFLIVEQMQRL